MKWAPYNTATAAKMFLDHIERIIREDFVMRTAEQPTDETMHEPREMLAAAREQARSVISRMHLPTTPTNAVQRSLQSGTPREFADGLVDSIGEISLREAQAAIRRYEDEWNRAGAAPRRRSTDHQGAGL